MSRSMNLFGVVVSLILILHALGGINANSEVDALIAVKSALIDPTNSLESWISSLENPCTWFHITCNDAYEVTRIDLGRSNLSGHLVPDIGKLKKLKNLELYGNSISGSIPNEIGNLINLVSLDLYDNRFNGLIPKTFGKLSQLKFLLLNNNNLSGCVPVKSWRDIIPHLTVVDISNNPKLCGPYIELKCEEC